MAQEIPPGQAVSGLFVTAVSPGGPAARAGLQPADVIVSIDGRATTSTEQLTIATQTRVPGDSVPLTYRRGSDTVEVDVIL